MCNTYFRQGIRTITWYQRHDSCNYYGCFPGNNEYLPPARRAEKETVAKSTNGPVKGQPFVCGENFRQYVAVWLLTVPGHAIPRGWSRQERPDNTGYAQYVTLCRPRRAGRSLNTGHCSASRAPMSVDVNILPAWGSVGQADLQNDPPSPAQAISHPSTAHGGSGPPVAIHPCLS